MHNSNSAIAKAHVRHLTSGLKYGPKRQLYIVDYRKAKEIRTSGRTNDHNIIFFAPDMTKLESERKIKSYALN